MHIIMASFISSILKYYWQLYLLSLAFILELDWYHLVHTFTTSPLPGKCIKKVIACGCDTAIDCWTTVDIFLLQLVYIFLLPKEILYIMNWQNHKENTWSRVVGHLNSDSWNMCIFVNKQAPHVSGNSVNSWFSSIPAIPDLCLLYT